MLCQTLLQDFVFQPAKAVLVDLQITACCNYSKKSFSAQSEA